MNFKDPTHFIRSTQNDPNSPTKRHQIDLNCPQPPQLSLSTRAFGGPITVNEVNLTEEDLRTGKYFAVYVGQNDEDQDTMIEINKKLNLRNRNMASKR